MSKIVSSIRKSTHDCTLLVNSVGFRIPSANATRWNSQWLQLKIFNQALTKDPSLQSKLHAFIKHGTVSQQELKLSMDLVICLETIKDATDEWQRDSESIGSVIPGYCDIRNNLLQFRRSMVNRANTCRDLANTLVQSLERRLGYIFTDTLYLLGKFHCI